MRILPMMFSIIFIFFYHLVDNTAYAKSNDPNGEIYISKNWGDVSNCGPIAALMVAKFLNKSPLKNLQANIDDARKAVQKDTESYRWWRLKDIKKYLSHKNIQYISGSVKNTGIIKNLLDQNGILVINVNMHHLAKGERIGKPYSTFPIPGGWRHYLVIVGYKVIDRKLVFEIHDSYVKKGNNRQYYAKDIMHALGSHSEVIVVNKNTKKSKGLIIASKQDKSLANTKMGIN